MKLNIFIIYKSAVFCILLLLESMLVIAQGTVPQFWQLNTSPNTLTWDLTPWNGQVDNGTGSFTAATFNWTANNNNYKIGSCKNIAFGGNPGVGAAGTVTLPGTISVSSISFHPAATANDFTIAGGSITGCRANLPVSVDSGLNPTITSLFSGSSALEKIGPGTLTISTNNSSYKGAVTVSDGKLRILGGSTYTISLENSFTNNADVYFVGNSSATKDNGGLFLATAAGSKVYGSGTWTIDSPVVPINIWTNRLAMFNCYATGSANLINYGNLWILFTAKSTLSVNLNGPNTYLGFYAGGVVLEIGTITGTGKIDFGDGGVAKTLTLSVGNDNGSGVFSGIISNSGLQNGPTTLALIKAGTGTQTLSGNNTYKGGTTINGGTLIADYATALGTAAVTINNGGTLTLNANIANAITVNAGGTLNRNGHSTGTVGGSGTIN